MRVLSGATLILLLSCGCCYGQAADTLPSYEVASVKQAPPPEPGGRMFMGMRGGPGSNDPTRVTFENFSMTSLVILAFDLKPYQLTTPSWANMERYNITAKVPEGATKEQARLMLRSLLIERFGLKVHHESKEMQVYELVVAKNGHKLKEHVEDPNAPKPDPTQPPQPPAMPTGPPKFELDKDGYPKMAPGRSGTMMMNGRARWQAVNESMESVAQRLSAALGHPVTDATGLKGKYDFTLLWSSAVSGMSMMGPMGVGMPPPPPPPAGAGPGGPEGGGGGAPMASMDDSGPTLQGAMQQQLGLRLESKKGMVDIVVVDRVEKVPTEN